MKNLFLSIFLFGYSITLTAQEESMTNRTYQFNKTIDKQNSLQTKNLPKGVKNQPEEIQSGLKVKVIEVKNDVVTYQYLPFSNDGDSKTKFGNNQVFTMPKSNFENSSNQIYSRYKGAFGGTYTIPFRLRGMGGDYFEFESSLSLNTNLIFSFGPIDTKDPLLDLSLGLGITGIRLTPENSIVDSNQTANAFTPSIGVVIKPNSKVNIGIFTGIDALGKSDIIYKWHHNQKLWLGLGINVVFNEVKNSKSNTSTN